MSLRLSSSQSAHFVSLWGGLGIPGDEIPTDGDNGGSPLANDGISPASEYRIETVTPPSAGALDVFPDTSYEFSGAPDGTYPWVYRVWEDSIDRGTATEYLVVGSPVVAFAVTPALPAFSGSITTGGVDVHFDVTPGLPAFSGGVAISPVVSSAASVSLPMFSGSVSTGGAVVWSDAQPQLPVFSGSVSSGSAVGFSVVASLPTFSGSISGYVASGGITLTPENLAAIADAVYAKFVAEGYENRIADALLSRTWP